jgi:transposase
MGRSRGGLTTKIHALVDANGLPIALKLTAGQAHDGRSAADMLDQVGAGQILLADRAYDSDALRQELADRGAWANIRPTSRRVNIPAFSSFLYRYRNLVERFFTGSSTSEPSRPASRSTTKTTLPSSSSQRRGSRAAPYESVT